MIIGITVENIYSASFFLYNFFSIKNKLSPSFISLLTSSGIWLVLIFPFFSISLLSLLKRYLCQSFYEIWLMPRPHLSSFHPFFDSHLIIPHPLSPFLFSIVIHVYFLSTGFDSFLVIIFPHFIRDLTHVSLSFFFFISVLLPFSRSSFTLTGTWLMSRSPPFLPHFTLDSCLA